MASSSINFLALVLFILNLNIHTSADVSLSSKPTHGPHCYENVTSFNNSNNNNSNAEANDAENRTLKCIPLQSQTCLDINLPYRHTTLSNLALELQLNSLDEINSYLQRWTSIRNLSRCWQPLQTMLCSSLLPECKEDQSGKIRYVKPTKDMCHNVKSKAQCKIIGRHYGWPQVAECDNVSMFAQNCTIKNHDLKFVNISPTKCPSSLVATEDNRIWLKNIEGCAISCNENPLYYSEDIKNIKRLIYWYNVIIVILSLFGVHSFSLDWIGTKESKIALAQRRLLICQLFGASGWLLQFTTSENLTCKQDDTILYGMQITGPILCELTFILSYYSSTVECICHAHLGFLCYEKLGLRKRTGSDIKDDKKIIFFAYTFPFILMVLIWFFGLVDGHSIFGICTIGIHNPWMAILFYTVPQAIFLSYGNFLFLKTSCILGKPLLPYSKIRKTLDSARRSRIKRYLMNILLLVIATTFWFISLVFMQVYELYNEDKWKDSLEMSISHELNLRSLSGSTTSDSSTVLDKPQIIVHHIYLGLYFVTHAVRIFWICSRANMRTWIKTLISFLERGLGEDELRKKKLRLGAFRDQVDADVTTDAEASTHCDPVDMTLTKEGDNTDNTDNQNQHHQARLTNHRISRGNARWDSRVSSETDNREPVKKRGKRNRNKTRTHLGSNHLKNLRADIKYKNLLANQLKLSGYNLSEVPIITPQPLMMNPLVSPMPDVQNLLQQYAYNSLMAQPLPAFAPRAEPHTQAMTPGIPTVARFSDFQFTHGRNGKSQVLENPFNNQNGNQNFILPVHNQIPNIHPQPSTSSFVPSMFHDLQIGPPPGSLNIMEAIHRMALDEQKLKQEEERKLDMIRDPEIAKKIQSLRQAKETSTEDSEVSKMISSSESEFIE